MKLQATNIVFDGHDWMRRLRLPYWTIAKMREMHVGDELPIFEFASPPMLDAVGPTTVTCHVWRAKGSWRLEALWMAHIGKAGKRGHIWSWIDFQLGTGSTITLLSEPHEGEADVLRAEYLVRKVCRLVGRLRRMAECAGDRHSMVRMMASPGYWMDDDEVVPFLHQIAAPIVGVAEITTPRPLDDRTAEHLVGARSGGTK